MRLSSLLTALLIAAAPGLASAAEVDSTKRIDQRQDRQEQRIEQGAKSGELTKKEARRLEKGQARIDAAEKKAAADGKITKEERARIEKMQGKQAREIHQERRDKQERGAAAGKAGASAGASTAATSAAATAAASGRLGTIDRAQQDAFVRGEEQKALADGRISPEERFRLDGYYRQVGDPSRFELYRERNRD